MRIQYPRPEEAPPAKPCFNCGDLASAMWSGRQDVYVCGECAVAILPKLIADAVPTKGDGGTQTFRDHLTEIHAGYWYAVACRLSGTICELQKWIDNQSSE